MKRILKAAGVLALGLLLSVGALGRDGERKAKGKKILFFTKSSGFATRAVRKFSDSVSKSYGTFLPRNISPAE